MTSVPPANPSPEGSRSPALPLETATRLLRLGLSEPRRPVDDLIDRLGAADGATWLEGALERVLGDLGSAREQLVEGRATIAQLASVKEHSQTLLRAGPDADSRLAGIAGYFLALAAALRHHGHALSSRGRDELDAVLLDLATAAPSPFSELLSGATQAAR
jgi:hypothetical protein